jgi:uncharacterized protein
VSIGVLLLLSVSVFLLAAVAQSVTGFGSALVAVPLLGVATSATEAVVAATVVGLVLTAGAWRRERHHVDVPLTRALLVAGLAGLPLGLLVLTVVDERILGLLASAVVLVAVPVLALAPRARPRPGAAGVLSGVLLAGSGMNGPPLVLALRHLEPRAFRATLQAVFCGQDAVAVLAFTALGLVTRDVALMSAAGVVGLPAGWAVGDAVFRRLSPSRLRAAVTVMLLVSALASGAAHAGVVRG